MKRVLCLVLVSLLLVGCAKEPNCGVDDGAVRRTPAEIEAEME